LNPNLKIFQKTLDNNKPGLRGHRDKEIKKRKYKERGFEKYGVNFIAVWVYYGLFVEGPVRIGEKCVQIGSEKSLATPRKSGFYGCKEFIFEGEMSPNSRLTYPGISDRFRMN
jgi:hypothetical protein